MITIHLIIKIKVYSLQLANLKVSSERFCPERIAVILAKFTNSSPSFEDSRGYGVFVAEKFYKAEFLQSNFIFVTYLPIEVNRKIISGIYFRSEN